MIGLLILIGGLVTLFVTNYDTLATILIALGGVIVVGQIVSAILVLSQVRKVQKEVFNDDFFGRRR